MECVDVCLRNICETASVLGDGRITYAWGTMFYRVPEAILALNTDWRTPKQLPSIIYTGSVIQVHVA